jgi:hypothetical protein
VPERLVVGAALGDCVHVAGVLNFLEAARRRGYHSDFLGPAVPVAEVVAAVAKRRPDLLALSYRLSPEAAERLFSQLATALADAGRGSQRMVFGGTPTVVEVAERSGLFEATFGKPDGPTVDDYLEGRAYPTEERIWSETLLERRAQAVPRPLLRHHFGSSDLSRTVDGVAQIAQAEVVDVISLGPDQNAQEHFFHPERMDPAQSGAGGVPVRSADDFRHLYEASRQGNHPLMRCYAGTNDQLQMAELLDGTIRNAWCAVPLFWYSELDGRSDRSLETAIAEQQELAAWSAARGIPVERNDQNQWALRYASDVVQIATAGLAAHLTAAVGAGIYVLQMMLNTPPGTSPAMDVAKMGAMETVVRRHTGNEVILLRELRAGLFSLPTDPDRARGQLASSTRTAMLLAPDILHVVGYTEAHHAIEAAELIASCTLVHQVIDDALLGLPDPFTDLKIAARRDRLVQEAGLLLATIDQHLPGAFDGDPDALAQIVRQGYFDAPYLAGNPAARGTAVTVVDGGCHTVDPLTGRHLPERDRLTTLGT